MIDSILDLVDDIFFSIDAAQGQVVIELIDFRLYPIAVEGIMTTDFRNQACKLLILEDFLRR